MPKLLFLGGATHQLPPIEYAIAKGYHTIVCDYTPDAPAFKIAHEHHQVSTTDLDAILAIARGSNIDGVVAYASDPAAYTAAYVARALGLPGNPLQAVNILTRKDLYRSFLHRNGFNAPKVYDHFFYPMVVKPVDSSGSKGVSIVRTSQQAIEAVTLAQSFSRCGRVIYEEYLERDGYQVAGDGFVVDGVLVFSCFAQEHFDKGGIVPVGESFPYNGDTTAIECEVQRLIDAIGFKTGAINFDVIIKDDKVYLMEIGPRNGGCLIPEVIKLVSGVDTIAATVEAALGKEVTFPAKEKRGFYSSYMIHAPYDGIYDGLIIDPSLMFAKIEIWVQDGDRVKAYTGSHCTIGTAILAFSSHEEMITKMDNMHNLLKVELK